MTHAPAKRPRTARAKAAEEPTANASAAIAGATPAAGISASMSAYAPAGEPILSASDREEIALLAYSYWEARGGQEGSAEDDWLRAEQEIRARYASK